MPVNRPLKYSVQYELVDPFKVLAQSFAASTDANCERLGLRTIKESRGESAFVIRMPDRYLVFVVEGLGTKNLITEAMYMLKEDQRYYSLIARCAISAYVNDAVTLGADVFLIGDIIEAGSNEWFLDEARAEAFCGEFANVCNEIGAVWGPGESAVLRNVIIPQAVSINGACIGQIGDELAFTLQYEIEEGDEIILLPSSGIHVNFLTACRDLAQRLPKGLQTHVEGSSTYGDLLLTPTAIYQNAIRALIKERVYPKYMVNISGHGWRKIMRAHTQKTYVIERLPKVPTICNFIREEGNMDDFEAYANMNMGAGFAIIVHPAVADRAKQILERQHPGTIKAGYVEEGYRRVVLSPLGVTYQGASLALRR